MKPREFTMCCKRLNLSRDQLAKLTGIVNIDAMTTAQDRCVRALVLMEDVRDPVMRCRAAFPNAVFTAVRSLEDGKR